MIGLLRLVGVMNAAVWLGATILYVIGVSPTAGSEDVTQLLGKNQPYYGGYIGLYLAQRFFHLHLACGVIALLHIFGEWIYLGRFPKRVWLVLVAALAGYALLQSVWLQPRLERLHRQRYALNTPAPARVQASRASDWALSVTRGVNWLSLLGLGAYLWRVANPPDTTRFVSAGKFRG